jgi:hypothetical protein
MIVAFVFAAIPMKGTLIAQKSFFTVSTFSLRLVKQQGSSLNKND